MNNPDRVSAGDAVKNTDGLSAQVQESYGFDKAKADAEVKQFMGARTF
ncbi:MAG TPA: hypothetical protein VKA61_11635 [Sphingomicrobium sp.]|nr:hypothetical protein [Sphingomicrobium sp.]